MQRAIGFARSLRRVHERAGAAGLLELVVARALPNSLSYARAVIVATPVAATAGADLRARPELHPRRVRETEPAVEAFFAQLAATGEPEVPQFSSLELERRFSSGQELWVFEVGGQIAHARWIVPGHRSFPGGSLPLRDDERASEGLVTAPSFAGAVSPGLLASSSGRCSGRRASRRSTPPRPASTAGSSPPRCAPAERSTWPPPTWWRSRVAAGFGPPRGRRPRPSCSTVAACRMVAGWRARRSATGRSSRWAARPRAARGRWAPRPPGLPPRRDRRRAP